ncbi:hypothetical protein M569_12785, partial [Genlisea aurea]
QAIPAYTMACFPLPKTFNEELNRLIARFWWSNRGISKIHWLPWKKITGSKKAGGLGFRDLHLQNQALLAKQGWNIMARPSSLMSRVLKAKYFPNSTFIEAGLGRSPSRTWRGIHASRQLLTVGLRWRVGSGEKIQVWKDPWIPRGPPFKPICRNNECSETMRVAELLLPGFRGWNNPLVRRIFHPIDANSILQLPVAKHRAEDTFLWHYTKKGCYSTASGYFLLQNGGGDSMVGPSNHQLQQTNFWTNLWQFPIPPKVTYFIWRLCSNILPTRQELHRRHLTSSSECSICSSHSENWRHLFLECNFATAVWRLGQVP